MAVLPSASYSLTVRLQITNRPGMLGACFPGFFRELLDFAAP